LDTGGAAADLDALYLPVRSGVEDREIGSTHGGNQHQLSVWREFQAVRAADVGV
jgi:hypothetical protein